MEPSDVLKVVEEKGVRWIDLQFTDVPGRLHHITVPASRLTLESFEKGFGKLDGSSIRGFTIIYESDMVLVPVAETFAILPWAGPGTTARMICKVFWGYGRGRFSRDPRYIAERAEEYLANEGYKGYFGPEVEFFIFDKVEVDILTPYAGMGYKVCAREAPWCYTEGYFTRFKEGYYPAPPVDKMANIRQEIAEVLADNFGFTIEAHHHEVATAGQGEIDFKCGGLAETADRVQTLKYVAKNVAAKYGMIATFMPKPMYGDNGSGMHTHVSLWDKDKDENLFFDPNDEYANLSQLGRYFIGGLLEHSRALAAIVAPTTNSYKRLVLGYEAPVYITWSKANRSAVVRVPIYHKNDHDGKRVEYRPPDPSANPYLCFAALVAAGLDGIKKKIDPGDPVDENVYTLTPEKKRELGIKELPRSLWEALDELESDKEFLKPIFTNDLIETYIELKREECRKVESYPTPIEVYLYLDI